MFKYLLWPVVCLPFLFAATVACAEEEIRMPGGVDYSRLKNLEQGRHQKMKVYVNMVGIGEKSDLNLLIPAHAGKSVGTHSQMNRRFMDAIKSTERFEVFDDSASGMRDQSDIVVDGMVVAATQDLEDYSAFRKSVTTVRLSLQVKDTLSGKVLRGKTLTGNHGSEPREGTLIRTDKELASKPIQESLSNDFERALNEVLSNAAAYVERTFRPLGKVIQTEDKDVLLSGGEADGLRSQDRLVVFRTSFIKEGGREMPGLMKPVALIECPAVSAETSQCNVLRQKDEIKPGYFALVIDDSIRLKEQ